MAKQNNKPEQMTMEEYLLAQLSEQEQQQAINDFRCGKYNQEQ